MLFISVLTAKMPYCIAMTGLSLAQLCQWQNILELELSQLTETQLLIGVMTMSPDNQENSLGGFYTLHGQVM
jgi:hypothetical protein